MCHSARAQQHYLAHVARVWSVDREVAAVVDRCRRATDHGTQHIEVIREEALVRSVDGGRIGIGRRAATHDAPILKQNKRRVVSPDIFHARPGDPSGAGVSRIKDLAWTTVRTTHDATSNKDATIGQK